MSSPPDPPIVVSGGSVHIDLDEDIFTPNGKNKRSHGGKKITSVEISVNGGPTQTINVPNGKVTVTIRYENK
ncbi:MAG: hypothetical protein JOZ96_15550 [Acidobacteria bacterium]|nr:hypothetical protein [Acidobacteriota bacterium]